MFLKRLSMHDRSVYHDIFIFFFLLQGFREKLQYKEIKKILQMMYFRKAKQITMFAIWLKNYYY